MKMFWPINKLLLIFLLKFVVLMFYFILKLSLVLNIRLILYYVLSEL